MLENPPTVQGLHVGAVDRLFSPNYFFLSRTQHSNTSMSAIYWHRGHSPRDETSFQSRSISRRAQRRS